MINWIKNNHKNNTCGINIATALPGTELWDYAKKEGLIKRDNFDWNKLSALIRLSSNEKDIVYLNKSIPYRKLLKKINLINLKLRIGTPTEFIKAFPRRLKKYLSDTTKLIHY